MYSRQKSYSRAEAITIAVGYGAEGDYDVHKITAKEAQRFMTAVGPKIAELKPSSKKRNFDHTDSVADMKERISS